MSNKNPSPETRFKPGQSGNPGGRPKGTSMTAVYRDLLDREMIEYKTTKGGKEISATLYGTPTIRHRMGLVLLRMAMNGDIHAIRELSDRTDGKVGAVDASIDAKTTDGNGNEMRVTITVKGTDEKLDV